ncbi:hypothetical protein [Sorangium sp. So ce1182]|uniref:hypothetical protein n=1 Tax=Sorangium sp. So ce1182 TaxID=3133334 RepID=UPI003F63E4F5
MPDAALLLIGLAAYALSGGACGTRTTLEEQPVPEVAFESWVNPPFMSVSRCVWAGPRANGGTAVECSLVLLRDVEMHGLSWIAYSRDGRELAQGGSALSPWKVGEERRVAFSLEQSPKEPIGRIDIEPF